MTLLFQNNVCIWYGGNYIDSFFKPKEELEDSKRSIEASRNLLQSYRNLFRPIFRHQHSTLIKYPLVQQTDNLDYNYFNKHLSAREKKFEHFPQDDFRIGKNHDSYYSTKLLLPKYKVLINPFFPRISMASKVEGNQKFVKKIGDTLTNRRPDESKMNAKGTRDDLYYCYGVKKRKPIHKKKKTEIDKLIYPHKAVGGLLLPSKIILNNFSSWRWKNKKEIQTNNLSMSMMYDLLLPKSTAHKSFEEPDAFYKTTKINIDTRDESFESQSVFPDTFRQNVVKMLSSSSCFAPTDRLIHKKTQINCCNHQEENTNQCYEMKNDMFSTCVSACGCETKYKDETKTFECFTKPFAITTEVPIIFKFEDYRCECYSCSNIARKAVSSKRRKVYGRKNTRKKHKIKGKEKSKFSKNDDAEIDLKADNEYKDKQTVKDKHDDLNIAKCIVISNDEVVGPDDEESCNYDFESTFSSILNQHSTKISRIKRRTFKSKSKWDRKRKQACLPINPYRKYLFRKPSAMLLSSSFYSTNRNFKVRRTNKYKKKHFEITKNNMGHKGLNLEAPNREVALKKKPKLVGLKIDNEKNKVYKKREFVGESQSGNASIPCEYEDLEDVSTSSRATSVSTDSVKTTFVTTDTEMTTHSTVLTTNTEKPAYSTLLKPHHFPHILSKATKHQHTSTAKSTRIDTPIVERTTKLLGVERATNVMPMFRPDTGNRHPAKLKCEQQYSKECICSVTKALEEINNLISNNPDQKFLLNQLTIYNCTHYSPLEINYKMSPELKPRLLSNKHKELLADETNGPKEIIDETFQELMIRDVPNEGIFYC